jgi:hypothetical protein
MSTPKEKARQLVDKFARIDGYQDSIDLSKCEYEKKCALIAVDEILNVIDRDMNYQNTYSFYLEVKQEIEKL